MVPMYVSCYPNAGLPNAFGEYDESPSGDGRDPGGISPKAGWLNIVGGCCGTTPEHIRADREAVAPFAPRTFRPVPKPYTGWRAWRRSISGPIPISSTWANART